MMHSRQSILKRVVCRQLLKVLGSVAVDVFKTIKSHRMGINGATKKMFVITSGQIAVLGEGGHHLKKCDDIVEQ